MRSQLLTKVKQLFVWAKQCKQRLDRALDHITYTSTPVWRPWRDF